VIFGRTSTVRAMSCPQILVGAGRAGSGSGTRTRDTAIMSRLLYRLSYPAVVSPYQFPGQVTARMDRIFRRCAVAPETEPEPPCGIEPQTFSLPWRRSAC
jgi:hypothetical protein